MNSLRWRLLLTHALVTGIALLAFFGVGAYWSYHNALQELEHGLEDTAITLANALEDHWNEYYEHATSARLASMIRLLRTYAAQHEHPEVTLLLPNGKPLLKSTDAPPSLQLDTAAPEWRALLSGQREEWEFTATTPWGEERLYVLWRVSHDNETLGVVLLESPLDIIWKSVWADLRWLGLGAVGIAVFSLLIAWGLARSLTRPLEHLLAGVTRFSQGDYAIRLQPQGPTEVQRLAQAFNEMATRLGAYIRDLRAFVAYAGHELRTPLTAIKLRLEALREGALNDPAVAQRYLDEAEAETDRLARMLNELLDLSRLDAGETLGTRELVDLYALAREVVRMFQPIAAQRQVQLELAVEPGLVSVWAHPEEMRRALVNLVDNAVKYTPPGGQVTVRLSTHGQAIRIEVEDTGPGIPPEDLPHLFNRFYRGRNALPNGTGLGLALVRAIAEAHHGQVGVSSRQGRGSRFWIEVPVRPPRPGDSTPPPKTG